MKEAQYSPGSRVVNLEADVFPIPRREALEVFLGETVASFHLHEAAGSAGYF
jgi:hypothetical protein